MDESETGAPLISEWLWDFGDGINASSQNPKHSFEQPGVKEITLRVTDVNGCEDEILTPILWAPAPTDIIVQPSSFIICTPGAVSFNNLTSPIDDSYNILWNFGDGNTNTDLNPSHVYDEPGIYTISLDIETPFGCEVSKDFPNWITIQEGPTAGFTFNPREVTSINPTVEFTDLSDKAANWQWEFVGESASRDQNPVYTFRDTGTQEIILIVTHENGCQDTAFASLDVVPITTYFLPNAFTPNNDTKNDVFVGVGTLSQVEDFEMIIWDKWGGVVFQTNDPFEGWNGKKNNTGKHLPNGVYVSIVKYQGPRGESREEKGYVTLIR